MQNQSKRERLDKWLGILRGQRATWEPEWKDILNQMLPYRQKWKSDTSNDGKRKNDHLYNNTPIRALDILSAGMMSGITSPSREWFKLTVSNNALYDNKNVKSYLDQCEVIIREKLAHSSWYVALANGVYPELGSIGTSCLMMEPDPVRYLRFESVPAGEYFLDVNEFGEVDTFFRERVWSARQVAMKFGLDVLSPTLRMAVDNGDMNQPVTIIQAIYPNDEYDPKRMDAAGKKWASCWWDTNDESGKFLRESGYEDFPVLAPRWTVRPGDAYGRGPGWEIRGDCRGLQKLEKLLISLVDKTSNPPMVGHEGLKTSRASLIPGDITYVPSGATDGFHPAIQIPPAAIVATEQNIMRHEGRIKSAMYVDLWQDMIQDDRAQRATATEIAARKQEIMLQLGPILENLNVSLLEPVINNAYAAGTRYGWLPPPPLELQGADFDVEFVSIAHQMQKMTALSGTRTLVQETGLLAQLDPGVMQKLNGDVIVDEIASMVGAKPSMVRTAEEVKEIRDAQAQKQQMAEQGQAMLAATQGVKNLGSANPQSLQDIASMISPVAAAQGGVNQIGVS
jgi:hypothetical protein